LNLRHPALARALHDFHSCLSKNNPDFYFYAYRAVEDIRSHFGAADDDDGKRKAWFSMNKALGREEKDYKELVDLAKNLDMQTYWVQPLISKSRRGKSISLAF
jgi:hypothetical protein